MILILLIVGVLLLIPTIYFGSWRAFFIVMSILAFPTALQLVHTFYGYLALFGIIFLFVCTLPTARTFFVYGVDRRNSSKNNSVYYFIWNITYLVFLLIAFGYVLYNFREDIMSGSTHGIIEDLGPSILATSVIGIILGSIVSLLIITLINHYVVKRKYVVTESQRYAKPGKRLRSIRTSRQKDPFKLYASESIFGVSYYYRKARPTDCEKIYDNRVTRFFERFEASFSGYHFFYEKAIFAKSIVAVLVAAFFFFSSLPSYISGTPTLKAYINEHITAPHYIKTTATVLKCGNIKEHQTSGKGKRIYYLLECDLEYADTIKTLTFERPFKNSLSDFQKEIEKNGVSIAYNPNKPKASYSIYEKECGLSTIVIFYITLAALVCLFMWGICLKIIKPPKKPKPKQKIKPNFKANR